MENWQDYRILHPGPEHTVSGTIKVLEQVYCPQLDNRRDILVYLPPSYASTEKRYPVLYFHDGQNVFDAATSYVGEWHADEAMEALSQEGIEAILVAVYNDGENRMHEYSPYAVRKYDAGGWGDRYLFFLCDVIKPLIDRTFRTKPERAHTGLIGSSMGGLISLYGFFRRPDRFALAGIMSSSFFVNGRAIYPYVRRAPFSSGKLYMDIGTCEVPEDAHNSHRAGITSERYLTGARHMAEQLTHKGYVPGETLLYVEDEGGIHHETAWTRRLPNALRFLLGG